MRIVSPEEKESGGHRFTGNEEGLGVLQDAYSLQR